MTNFRNSNLDYLLEDKNKELLTVRKEISDSIMEKVINKDKKFNSITTNITDYVDCVILQDTSINNDLKNIFEKLEETPIHSLIMEEVRSLQTLCMVVDKMNPYELIDYLTTIYIDIVSKSAIYAVPSRITLITSLFKTIADDTNAIKDLLVEQKAIIENKLNKKFILNKTKKKFKEEIEVIDDIIENAIILHELFIELYAVLEVHTEMLVEVLCETHRELEVSKIFE